MLDRQPEVNFPVGKEIHFWDLNFSFDNDWYESKFETVWYMRAFTNSKNFKQGDFTPAYVILEPSVINKIYIFSQI